MQVVYVKWRDAYHSQDEFRHSDLGALAELHEVGFLIKETPESVTLTMERQDGVDSSRLWLTIPRVNIIELRTWDLRKLLKGGSGGIDKKRPGRKIKSDNG